MMIANVSFTWQTDDYWDYWVWDPAEYLNTISFALLALKMYQSIMMTPDQQIYG